ncbi:MAG: SIS domain-containing protein [Candidatus Diapherotrites archaeon]
MGIKDYFEKLKQGLDAINESELEKVADVLFETWKRGKQVFIFGNGGSATTALHFSCDLGKNTVKDPNSDEKRFRIIPLVDNIATLTALANDSGYENIFSEQLKNLVMENDVVIVISGSGKSPNVLKAVEVAKNAKAIIVSFTGFDGGKLKSISDYNINFNENHYGRIEDAHLILEHLITEILKERISDSKGEN